MDVSSLHMPLEFVDDNFALAYVRDTEARVRNTHARNRSVRFPSLWLTCRHRYVADADNSHVGSSRACCVSPVVVIQRVVRGFLSRSYKLPRVARVCELVVRVQKCVRGFLLRQTLVRSFLELVCAHGLESLLAVTSTDSPLLPTRARHGLKKLVVYVQEWKRQFHLKKQAIAIKKIRFWCQMAYQRYANKAKRLLRDEHQVFIYYTPEFECELLAIADRAAHRDPFLMAMAPGERAQFIRERCRPSGVSVLRIPHQSTCSLRIESPMVRTRRRYSSPQQSPESTKPSQPTTNTNTSRSATIDPGSLTAVVRVFPSDRSLENRLLVTEKHFLQRDLKRIAELTRAHGRATTSTDSELPTATRAKQQQPRAVLVHLAQLALELRKRLVICNRKLLRVCVKQQQQCQRPRFTLARVRIRARGHSPAHWERAKITHLSARAHESLYPTMHVLLPWSIDMYLQILSALDRTLAGSCTSAFALSYAQVRAMSAAVSIQCAWRAHQRQSKRHSRDVAISRALCCLQRWWRFRLGLKQRLDFVRSALRLCATTTSCTLFMEESVFRVVSDASSWAAVGATMRRCKEHSMHCRIVGGSVEVVLSPSALLLRTHSQQARRLDPSISSSPVGASMRAAYLPVWLPGTPEHTQVSMETRDDDATPRLLTERVLVEPTLLERELLVAVNQQPGSPPSPDNTASRDLFRSFALCRQVVETSARVAELSRRLSTKTTQFAQAQPSVLTLDATSFMRLTFESVDEARKRALVLLSRTFDPVTRSYARLYSVEALVGAALRHHQVQYSSECSTSVRRVYSLPL